MARKAQDNTSIVQMMRDFRESLGNQSSIVSSHHTGHSGGSSVVSRLNFDQSSLLESSDDTSHMHLRNSGKESTAHTKDAELIDMKVKLVNLEAEKKKLQLEKNTFFIQVEKEKEKIRLERQKMKDKTMDMNSRLKFLSSSEQKLREELSDTREELNTARLEYEKKLYIIAKEKIKVEQELWQLQENSRADKSKLERELTCYKSDLKSNQQELETVRTQLRSSLKRSHEATSIVQNVEEYEKTIEDLERKVKELEGELERLDEDRMVNRTMRKDLAQLPQLKKSNEKYQQENKYLRTMMDNNELLKTQLADVHSKLERAEQRVQDLMTLDIENENLRRKLKQYADLVLETSKGTPISPTEYKARVNMLQRHEQLMDTISKEYKNTSSAYLDSCETWNKRITDLSQQLEQEHQKSAQLQTHLRQSQKKLAFMTKERDGFRNILDSYEHDMTMAQDTREQNRIILLEQQVENHKTHIDFLDQELKKAIAVSKRLSPVKAPVTPKIDATQVEEVKRQLAVLQEENENLLEDKHVLEARLEQRNLQGDYDPRTTKIMHFSQNPTSMAQKKRAEDLAKLREHNAALLERVRILEESGSKAEDITLKVEEQLQESSKVNVEDLKSKLKREELKNQRLVEVFQKKSNEFREVIYDLTGYRVDLKSDNQYKLLSMYAESAEDFFLFKLEDGNLQMLETDFSQNLASFIETYLTQGKSIPAFLSSVTLELFSNVTKSMTFS